MFEQVREQVLGIVENMSYLEQANGERLYIFGKGGGAKTAKEMNVPLLAEIPLDPATREGGDSGKPITTRSEGTPQTALFEQLAKTVIERANETKNRHRPTMTIAD
jgi:ATP-binding protein involved in chromosome partitioning